MDYEVKNCVGGTKAIAPLHREGPTREKATFVSGRRGDVREGDLVGGEADGGGLRSLVNNGQVP